MSHTVSDGRWALPALFLGAAGIGFAPIFVRLAGMEGMEPVATAFWRQALAVPLLLPWLLWSSKGQIGPVTAKTAWPVLAAGLFFAADLAFWHWSITLTSVANATLLANLNTVFVALIGFFFLYERLGRLFWAGLMAACLGTVLLIGGSLGVAGRLTGDLLGVITACMYAGYFLSARAARTYWSTAQTLLGVSVVTAIALLAITLTLGERVWPSSLSAWAPLFGVALMSQVLGQGLILYALKHLPAAFSAVSLLLQPVVATLVAWALFGEVLGIWEFAGAAMVLSGIVFARLGSLTRQTS